MRVLMFVLHVSYVYSLVVCYAHDFNMLLRELLLSKIHVYLSLASILSSLGNSCIFVSYIFVRFFFID